MAKLKVAVIGGGGARIGTGDLFGRIMKDQFAGSTIVLMDKDDTHLEIVLRLSEKLAKEANSDVRFEATTDLRNALTGADAVLTTFRPGGLKARHLHESIPLKYGIVGNETIAPGGTYLSWQAIHAMKDICRVMDEVSKPEAIIFNYTNHVPLVSQGTVLSGRPVVSFCEGPEVFPPAYANGWDIGLDASQLDTMMIGLNHACFTVRQQLNGLEYMPILERRVADIERDIRRRLQHLRASIARLEKYPAVDRGHLSRLKTEVADLEHYYRYALALPRYSIEMGSLAAHYYDNIIEQDVKVAEILQKGTTRAQDLMAQAPAIWEHYREQAFKDGPAVIDPERSRGSVWEMKLAIEAISSVFNDEGRILPTNIPNRSPVKMHKNEKLFVPTRKIIADFPQELVVEVWAQFNREAITPVPLHFTVPPRPGQVQDARLPENRYEEYHMPSATLPMLTQLGEYQMKAGRVGWDDSCTRADAIDCLASHPIFQNGRRRAVIERLHDDMMEQLLRLDPTLLPERLLKD